ncbi:hypothetical protein Tco_0420567 [Tanacetum coccineum]
MPFVTSSVTLTPERKGGGHTDSVFGPNLRTRHPAKRFVISSDSSHHSSTNAVDAEVTSIVRYPISQPLVMTTAVAATVVTGTSSAPMDSETLQQIYVPKWNVINDYALDDLELSLKEAEVAEAIRLRSQVSVVEAAKAARVSKLNSLKEQTTTLEAKKSTLEGEIAALESAAVSKDTKLASSNAQITKLTQDLSNFQLSCDELSIKVASLEYESDNLTDQDEHVKILSDRVAELVFELMGTTIGLAINKGMQTRLLAGIDHEKAEMGLAKVAAYDPSVEERYVSIVLAFCGLGFNLLSQLESQKDASIADIMDSLCLEETSLSDSLSVVHDRVQKVKEGALSHRLSISEAMGPLVDPLSSENLIGEASTSGVPATTATTTALSVLVTTADVSSIPPISVADYEVLDAEPQPEASHSSKVVFEKEDLDTTPDYPSANSLAWDGKPDILGIPVSLSLRLYAWLASSSCSYSFGYYGPWSGVHAT